MLCPLIIFNKSTEWRSKTNNMRSLADKENGECFENISTKRNKISYIRKLLKVNKYERRAEAIF